MLLLSLSVCLSLPLTPPKISGKDTDLKGICNFDLSSVFVFTVLGGNPAGLYTF